MLELYDLNRVKTPLTKYSDLYIESTLSTGDKVLSFFIPIAYAGNIKEECYIRTKTDEFVIKECPKNSSMVKVKAKLNIEELDGTFIESFNSTEHTIVDCVRLALIGTGWTVKSDVNKKRTIKKSRCYAWDIIRQVLKTYAVEVNIDSINKQLTFAERLGEDKGTYFTDQLNLRSVDITSDTYNYFTRLIPVGKDGLTIGSANENKDYVENYQYSNKIRTAYWKDDRYTDVYSLKEDAILKLKDMSKPTKSYVCSIVDLAKDGKHELFSYRLGDTVTLIDRVTDVYEKQRIFKIKEYPEDYSKNSCELANLMLTFDEMAEKYEDTVDTISNVTVDDSTIDGTTINGITSSQIVDLEMAIMNNAVITNLTAEYVQISGELTTVTARIGTLETTALTATTADIKYAKIDLTNIAEGSITTAMIGTGAIENAQIADGSITDAKIVTLTANKIGAGTLDAGVINVTNLNCANLTVGTINGQQISNGAIDLSKLGTDVSGAIDTAATNASTALANAGLAVDKANNATTIANGKNKTYYASAAPTTNLVTGDLWFNTAGGNKMYRYSSGTGWVAAQFGSAALDSTVNTNINNAQTNASTALANAGLAVDKANNATSIANGKNKTYYTNTAPTTDLVAGDLWFNTADGYKMYRYSGTAWVAAGFGTSALDGTVNTNINNAQTNANTALNTINNLQIGGRNIFLNSKTFKDWINNGVTLILDAYKGFTATEAQADWRYAYQDINVEDGKQYTISAWVKNTKPNGNVALFTFFSSGGGRYNFKTTTEWEKYEYTFTSPRTGVARIRLETNGLSGYSLFVCALKLEVGNKATDWTPAPEDAQADIAAASIVNWCYNNNTAYINGSKLYAGTVNALAITSGSITSTQIASGTIIAGNIASGAITADKIAANTITGAQIAANTITAGRIVAGTITATQMGVNSITAEKIAANAVTAEKIIAGAITADKIAAATITSTQIATSTIIAGNIASGAITTDKLAANAVTAAKILANTITATQIAANTITGNKIAANTITAGNIAASTITAALIAANAITTDKLAANAVTADKIVTGAITADKIAAATITGNKIAANTITAGNLSVSTLSAITANLGAVTAGVIRSTNYAANVSGMQLTLATGAWDSKYTKISNDGTLTCSNLISTNAQITGGSIKLSGKTSSDSYISLEGIGNGRLMRSTFASGDFSIWDYTKDKGIDIQGHGLWAYSQGRAPTLTADFEDGSFYSVKVNTENLYATNNVYIGGLPVCECGSNGDGEYHKFYDGTLICTKTVYFVAECKYPWGALYETNLITLGSYAHAFITTPNVMIMPGNGHSGTAGALVEQAMYPGTGVVGSVYLARPTSGTFNFCLNIQAIGRWK